MSNTDTEKRVVQMEFDNSKFDKNVKKSTKTLDDFEKKLEFKDVSSSLNVVKKGFSAFEIAAITAISNITTQVMNLGVRIVKSLSIDQISQGWQKFGDKTIAVATLAAQKIKVAGQELTEYEEKMEGINEQLEKMEWFTNETSYTFNDMVAALGKFTASGQDLDKSVDAMMGIATWASMSGANAQKASSAMTQLAQTLGRGYVLRIDWQSIQTLNMDTQMFREKVLETGVELGKLTKAGNDFISKTGAKINATNFTETLKSKWFTSEILVSTLEKYAAAVQDIYEISEKEGISARRVIEKYGASLDEFGVKAFKAAQETRTLNEALVYVFSTIGSTWSQSFEHLIGSYDEAKTLWSDLSDALYDSVIASNDFRNEVLKVWEDLEGRSDLFKHGEDDQGAFWNIYDSIEAVKQTIKNAKNEIFPKTIFEDEDAQITDLGRKFKEYTQRLKESTARMKEAVTENTEFYNILKGIFTVLKFGIQILQGIWNAISPIVDVLKWIVSDFFDRLSIFSDNLSKTEKVTETIMKTSERLKSIFQKIIDVINPKGILSRVYNFLENIVDLIVNTIKPVETLETIIDSFIKSMEDAGGTTKNFEKIGNGLLSILSSLFKIIKALANIVAKYVLPVVTDIVKLLAQVAGVIAGVVVDILGLIGDLFSTLDQLLDGNLDSLKGFKENIFDFLSSLPGKLKTLGPILSSILSIVKDLIEIILLVPKALDNISKALTGRGIVENIKWIFEQIADALRSFKDALGDDKPDTYKNLFRPITALAQGLASLVRGLLSILEPTITLLGQLLDSMGQLFQKIGEKLKELADQTTENYDKVHEIFTTIASILAVVLIISSLIFALKWAIEFIMGPIAYIGETAADGIYAYGKGIWLTGVARIIRSVGESLLLISASLMIIGKMNDSELIRAVSVLGSFIIVLGGLAVALVILNKTMGRVSSSGFLFTKKTVGTTTAIDSIIVVIKKLTTGMIKLAIAMKMVASMKPDDMWRSFGVLAAFIGILGGLSVLLVALGAITSLIGKKANTVNNSLLAATNMVGNMSNLVIRLAVAMLIMSWIPYEDMWEATKVLISIMGMLTAMVVVINFTAKFAKGGGSAMMAVAKLTENLGKLIIRVVFSIAIISALDALGANIWGAFGMVAALLGIITGMIIAINLTAKYIKGKNAAASLLALDEIIKSVKKMLLAFTVSIIALSFLDPIKMAISLGAVGAFMALLIALMISINKTLPYTKSASKSLSQLPKIILALSVMLLSFAGAMMMISNVPWLNLTIGIAGVLLVFSSLFALLLIMQSNKAINKTKSTAMLKILIGISVMLLAFGAAMLMIGQLDLSSAGLGIAGIIGLIAGIVFLTKFSNDLKKVKDIIKDLILNVMTLIISFAFSLFVVKDVNTTTALAFIGGLVVIISTIAIIGAMGKKKFKNTKDICLLLLSLCPLLLSFGASMALLASVNWSTILAASVGMVGVILALALASKIFDGKNSLSFGAGLLIMSIGLVAMSVAMKSMEGIDWSSIGKGLAILAGGMLILMIGSAAASGAIIFATAIILLGAGLLFAAMGMQLLATALVEFCSAVVENADLIKEGLITAVTGLVSGLVEGLVQGILSLLQALPELLLGLIDIIVDTIVGALPKLLELITALAEFIHEALPILIPVVIEVLHGILQVVREVGPDLIETVMQLIEALLTSLDNHIVSIVNKLVDIIIKFIDTLATRLPDIVAAIVRFLESLVKTIVDFCSKIPGKIVEVLKQGFSKLKSVGKDIINSIKQGVTEAWNAFIKFFKDLWNGLKNWFKDTFGIHSPSTEFKSYGKYMMEGLEEGVAENSGDALGAVDEVAEKIKDGFTDEMDINSPSKVFKKYGDYMMQGLSNGIQEGSKEALTDIKDNTSAMIDTISKVADYVGANINDDDLTIRPVLDLSDVASGVSTMSSMLSSISGKGVSISSNLASDISKSKSKSEGSSKDPNGQVVNNNEGDNYYSTFNITASNPEDFARQADTILQRMRKNAKLANGGAR